MKESPPKKGAPGWMATFADMSTLLLTFFILLLSFASMDVSKFQEMLGSVAKAYGVSTKLKGEYQAVLDDSLLEKIAKKDVEKWDEEIKKGNLQGEPGLETEKQEKEDQKEKEKEKIEKLSQKLKNAIKSNKMQNMAEVITGSSGIRIRIKGYQMFNPGEAELKKKNMGFLDTIYEGMNLFNYNLLVEGHTDNRPIYSEKFPSNWELSSARASSVLRYLQNKGIKPKRLFAVGYADQYPIADNSDKKMRAKNRRVEFVFTQKKLRMAIEDEKSTDKTDAESSNQ